MSNVKLYHPATEISAGNSRLKLPISLSVTSVKFVKVFTQSAIKILPNVDCCKYDCGLKLPTSVLVTPSKYVEEFTQSDTQKVQNMG
jgi:hypothetical protein